MFPSMVTNQSSTPQPRPRPIVLIVLDGFGIAPDAEGNAITKANAPTFSRLTERYPAMTLRASSEEVGLNWGEMGNSEVGHLAIGAGRVYYQTLPRINHSIADGSFEQNPALKTAIDKIKQTGGTLHLMGILSSGKVHGFDEHCFALLEFARRQKIKDVAIHAILDGRDTVYNVGVDFLATLQKKIKELKKMQDNASFLDEENKKIRQVSDETRKMTKE